MVALFLSAVHLCLSRACLGKVLAFRNRLRERDAFFFAPDRSELVHVLVQLHTVAEAWVVLADLGEELIWRCKTRDF